ncbi:SUKH superfamily protein [Tenacibaculum skagerrakense]|uniref:SUKH superfamily protein n=1 Tax=Tenacibaculum skagerrakense TaxID=186571 RepID=A0A4R2NR42_9FLAO|nr:SMI1/KNR4 family protein [Tenacibaculum skagerrakense]TCP24379.1 SUKH superfamily protein [Tenacibaculum skagerrakense]
MGKSTLKIFVISVLLILAMGFVYLKNKDASKSIEHNVSDKTLIKNAKQQIDSIKQSSFVEDTMMELIISLADDYDKHKNVGTKLSDIEIEKIEEKLNLTFPESYKLFLKYFGDGADLVYNVKVMKTSEATYITNQFKDLSEELSTEDETIQSSSLLSLTNKNNNEIAWYWVVDQSLDNNEWGLACFNSKNLSIEYTVENFTKWLEFLVKSKNNVVTELQNLENAGVSSDAITSSYLK